MHGMADLWHRLTAPLNGVAMPTTYHVERTREVLGVSLRISQTREDSTDAPPLEQLGAALDAGGPTGTLLLPGQRGWAVARVGYPP